MMAKQNLKPVLYAGIIATGLFVVYNVFLKEKGGEIWQTSSRVISERLRPAPYLRQQHNDSKSSVWERKVVKYPVFPDTDRSMPKCGPVEYRGPKPANYVIPDDAALDGMDEDGLMECYWKYIHSHQLKCVNQSRLGSRGNGGKIICLDNGYIHKPPCLVYSFGSNFNFDFEVDVSKRYNCEIHTFDPSKPIGDRKIPTILQFHLIGLSGNNTVNDKGWKMMTLSAIMDMLNHSNRLIDILKIDIEGSEWLSLPAMYKSGVLQKVKQLSIELHFGRSKPKNWKKFWGDVSTRDQLESVRQLNVEGLRLFSHEYVTYSTMGFKDPYHCITNQNEISLININLK